MPRKEPSPPSRPRPIVAPERQRTPFGSIEFRAHATDLTVELRGHSAQDIFRLAAWALARVQLPEWSAEPTAEDAVDLTADGWDDLLVNWMNQLLALSERHRAVWTEVEFTRLDEAGLAARVRGRAWPENPEAPGQELKAASYVGLELVPGPSLWLARVTLDL